jgi:hypothetical protein
MAKLNQPADKLPASRDDLQQIKGIGPFTAVALNNLGIYRFSDLVNFTPESLADLLKTMTASISPQRIERDNWLGQARALTQRPQEPSSPQPETDEADQPLLESQVEAAEPLAPQALDQAETEESPLPFIERKERNRATRENWRELADFFVSFGYTLDEEGRERLETKVIHYQVDQSDQWEGVATSQLLNWMLRQANLPLLAELETEVEAETPATPAPLTEETVLELAELWVSEVKMPALADGQQAVEMLRAESRLNLTGPAANNLAADQLPFRFEIYLVNTETHHSQLIASQEGQLTPGVLSYEVQQDFPLPAIGRYQLYLIASVLPPGDAVVHLQGPVIRIEE